MRTTATLVMGLAVALAGCGGGEDGGPSDEVAHAEFVAATTEEGLGGLTSGLLEAGVDAKLGDLDAGEIRARMTGPFGPDGVNFGLEVEGQTPGGGPIDFRGDLTVVASRLFIGSWPDIFEVDAKTSSLLTETAREAGIDDVPDGFEDVCLISAASGNGDPAGCRAAEPDTWFREVSDQGTTEVGGVQTEHVRAEMDVPVLAAGLYEAGLLTVSGDDSGNLDPDEVGRQTTEFVKEVSVDAYGGVEDGITRRLELSISGETPEGPFDVSVYAEFDEVGQPQPIPPPRGQIRPIEALAARAPLPAQQFINCYLTAESPDDLRACGFLFFDTGTATEEGGFRRESGD